MESILTEATRQFLGQGLGWGMAVIFGILAWLTLQKREADRSQCDKEIREIYRERIAEAASLIRSMDQATKGMVDMAAALEEQATARQALFQLVSQMERDMDKNNEAWKPLVSEILRVLGVVEREIGAHRGTVEKEVSAIVAAVERLQQPSPSRRA